MKNVFVECLKNEKKIFVYGYQGNWSVIDDYQAYVLLEHNCYGDETCYLVVRASHFEWKAFTNKRTQQTTYYPYFNERVSVYETYDDIETALEDYELI